MGNGRQRSGLAPQSQTTQTVSSSSSTTNGDYTEFSDRAIGSHQYDSNADAQIQFFVSASSLSSLS